MTFQREWLDEVLPECPALYREARSIIVKGDDRGQGFISAGILWLAEQTEADWLPRPAWKDDHRNRFEWANSVSAHGLQYKPRTQYLTAEGWPLGTQCWYVILECGFREFVCGETPELALARAILIFTAALKWRDTNPQEREQIEEVVRELARDRNISDE